MRLRKFYADNFRNIENARIDFSQGVNLFRGDNAQGKTNALEGIYLFARGKSFRAREDKELVRFGEDGFRIFIEYETNDGIQTLEYASFGRQRRRKKNGYNISGLREMLGSFKAVLFFPDDLSLVKDSPEERRAFLNVAIGQCYSSYIGIYSDFKNALENRNRLLKNASRGLYTDEREIFAWSESMAEYAAHIYLFRKKYISDIEKYAKRIMLDISLEKEELSLSYKSDISEDLSDKEEIKRAYIEVLTSEIEREKAVGVSLFGPQRDDMEIMLSGISARSFASQGQQRSIVLALKLAEGEVNKSISGEYPVFLFDDVLSELDESRRRYVLSGKGERQIIISSCETDTEIFSADRIYEVSSGKYELIK